MFKKLTMLLFVFGSFAYADSFFWAVNQFTTIQKLNGDTGAVVDSFAAPFIPSRIASIAVIGNEGYYTDLDLSGGNVYKVNMTTHAYDGVAFNSGNSAGINGITVDSSAHLWMAYGGTDLREFTATGTMLGEWNFPVPAGGFRDGSTIVSPGVIVANRGDQVGPYDKYAIGANGSTLTYIANPFITAFGGNNGIAFNGVNYYISNEQTHIVSKYDINGNFVSQANLDTASRYENWTFASQDISVGPVPEPTSIILFGTLALGLLPVLRKRAARS
jgi:hypothetical protein